ncbi:MAG: hypothetical protein K6T26_05000 [Alicyclobacillus sp.]|nr:hypothetical protein [Alicyclobacillus sp.]
MSPFWVWFWHIVGGLAAVLLGLPTFVLKRMSERAALHPVRMDPAVVSVLAAGRALPAPVQADVLTSFCQANFLYRYSRAPLPADRLPALSIRVASGVEYQLFPSDTAERPALVYVRRRRGQRETWYALQSPALAQQVVDMAALCNTIPSGVH